MDGILIVDKPRGVTSHDVVAVARRALGERRIGHTGTLDPLATGVLPLALGRATRLVRFFSADFKEYDAVIRLGLTTDSYDITGHVVSEVDVSRAEALPPVSRIEAALDAFRGDYPQEPPPVSAKHVGGRRAHALVRAGSVVRLPPVDVKVPRLDLRAIDGARIHISLTCSSGFYVRALAHSLGAHLGCGGCLEELRRTRCGPFGLTDALGLDAIMLGSSAVDGRTIALERLLTDLPCVVLTPGGMDRVVHGMDVGEEHAEGWPTSSGPWVRLTSPAGALMALGSPGATPASLHPSVVLI